MTNIAPSSSFQSLAEILLASGSVQQDDLDRAREFQKSTGRDLSEILLSQGACSEEELAEALSTFLSLPRLAAWLEQKGVGSITEAGDSYGLDSRWWIEQNAFPLGEIDDVIWVALGDPQEDFVASVLRRQQRKAVQPVIVTGYEIRQLHSLIAESDSLGSSGDENSLIDLATGAPVIQFVNNVIQRALDGSASDIHFESYRGVFRVRIRVDGVMHEIDRPASNLQAAILSRLKLMANLDISEKRLPQDGRIRMRVSGKDLDIRVATSPGIAGESIVLRLLDRRDGASRIDDLNLFDDQRQVTERLLATTNGILLVTGPTGSGKTTTLYSYLDHLASDERKIITVEDPVEYQTSGITQIQVKSEIGLDFAAVLRSVLRQDPDIILVGEIRDGETAEIAVQAALTGHLVLSTLHTNDAPSSFVRLIDMGVEPYLLASSVIGVLAQRLVRRVCDHCQVPDETAAERAAALGFKRVQERWPQFLNDPAFVRGAGCDACLGTGYRGRLPIFEIFEVDDELESVISTRPEALRAAAVEKGMRGLREDGLLRAARGETTLSEILRVVG